MTLLVVPPALCPGFSAVLSPPFSMMRATRYLVRVCKLVIPHVLAGTLVPALVAAGSVFKIMVFVEWL